MSGESLRIEVAARLGELSAQDVVLECIIGLEDEHGIFTAQEHVRFNSSGNTGQGDALFELDLAPPLSGLQFYKLRLYPCHPLLSHPFETGRLIWL
jgi:starch phosphorylase